MQVVGGGLNGQEVLLQWQIQERGLGAGPHPLPLFLDQTEAKKAEKKFVGDRSQPPPPPSRPPLPYLKISRSGSGAHKAGENPWPLHLCQQA